MPNQNHILFSYAFDKKGSSLKLKNEDVARELENDGLAWIHLDGNSRNSKKWLEKEVSYLDHLVIDALFAQETRPRIIDFNDGMLLILRGISGAKNNELSDENIVSIRLWVDKSRIISIQRDEYKALTKIINKLDDGLKIKSVSEFLYNLTYETLLLISKATYALDEKMDEIEDAVLEGKYDDDLREKVSSIKKKTTILKRYMIPQREVISRLKSKDSFLINSWAKRHFEENYDLINHIIEEVDEAKERSQIAHDEISNAISDRLNKSMFKISFIASIFMPLSFVAGLFGMNVGGIPAGNNASGFYIIILSMIFFCVLSFFFLKKKQMMPILENKK